MAQELVTVTAEMPMKETAPTMSLAPGFRFHPSDVELVKYYLWRKTCGKPFQCQAITEVDVYKSEPWELSAFSSLKTRDLERYFFSPVDKKYGKGSRVNRATGQGFWKLTGKEFPVRHQSQIVGMKKTLVFHTGRAPKGSRTNWVMHEYRLADEELGKAGEPQEAFVLCRIFKKSRLGHEHGARYAPFIDEEWDNDGALLVPGGEAEKEMANGEEMQVGGDDLEQNAVENPTELPNLEKSVPPGWLKYGSRLESEISNVTKEREALKNEMIRAQMTMVDLLSKTESLNKENADLKRCVLGKSSKF